MKKININNSGMTLVEVSLGMMVMVIFLSVFSLVGQYFQTYIKYFLPVKVEKVF